MAGNSRTGSDLSWDAMEGLIDAPPPPPEWSFSGLLRYVRQLAPGLLIAIVVGLAAAWIADHYGGPVMLFALLLGMGFHFLSEDERCRPGIDLTARGVLRLGVGLLGLRDCHGRQRRNADNSDDRILLQPPRLRHHRCDGECRRRAANRNRPAG